MLITKKHMGRPIDLYKGNGRTNNAHGRILEVKHKLVTVNQLCIDNVHNTYNGTYTTIIKNN